MYRELELKTAEDTTVKVPFKSTGTTAIRFKQFTGKELTKAVEEASGDTYMSDIVFSKLAYIMHKQAIATSVAELSNLNEEDYIEWLDGFQPLVFTHNSDAVADIYTCNVETFSDAKKNPDQQTEK